LVLGGWSAGAAPALVPRPVAASASAIQAAQAARAAAPIFVLNSLEASVSVIDPLTMTELRRLPTGKEPHHLYLSPDERSLLVANAVGDSITFIDPVTGDLQRTLTGITDPYHLRFSPDMKWFVTAANRLDQVAFYRWSPAGSGGELQLVKKVATGKTPSHLAIDSASTVVYASMQDGDELTAIDLATQTPRWTIPVGRMPADVYLTPDDKQLLVGLTGDEFVEVYDVGPQGAKLAARIRTGAGAHAFRAWGDGRHVLVSNRVANTISRIDLKTLAVVDTYPAPGGPDCIEVRIDAQGARSILVTSRWAGKLTVIDPVSRQVVSQVRVGRSPHGVWTLSHAPRHEPLGRGAAPAAARPVASTGGGVLPAATATPRLPPAPIAPRLAAPAPFTAPAVAPPVPAKPMAAALPVKLPSGGAAPLNPPPSTAVPAKALLGAAGAAAEACTRPVYLTFDTGHMGVATGIAEVLQRQRVPVTFFLADEPTQDGGSSLDDRWAPWWRARAAEGHAFASHTRDHWVWRADLPDGRLRVQATAGAMRGRPLAVNAGEYCEQLRAPMDRFRAMVPTAAAQVLPLFRAPAGRTSPALLEAGQDCGMRHVGWSPAGFLGDELPSDRYPNPALLAQALRNIRAGDVLMAHLGIWSRQDPWAPAVLEPLIEGLKARGLCFATLRSHPDHRDWIASQAVR
jgi:YVTN family beta-propeller protein